VLRQRRLAPAIVVALFLAFASSASANPYVVNNSLDPDNTTGSCSSSGTCSLRQAVNAANANAGADTITFSVTSAHVTNGPVASGIHSTGPITIDGGGTVTILADSGNNTLVMDNSAVTAISSTLKNIALDGQGTFNTGNGGAAILAQVAGGGANTLTLDHTTVKGFTSSSGGAGLEAASAAITLNVVDSTIKNNTASAGSTGGGGIYASDGHLNVTRSTLSGNTAPANSGGAINAAFGGAGTEVVTIVDSTITGNSASQGSAIQDNTGNLKISFSTITGNTSSLAGTGAIEPGGFTTDRFKGNILNNPGSPKECGNITQATVDGFNFFRDATCQTSTTNSNHPSTAISVGALQDNGGPTFTQALPSGSAAINSVPTGNCTDLSAAAVTTDQRGIGRPQDGACDAGAFEFVPAPVNSVAPSISGTAAVGQTLTCDPGTWSGSPTFAYEWRRDGTPITGATGATYNVAAADAGHSLVCHVTGTNSAGSTTADSTGVAIPAGTSGGGAGGGGTTPPPDTTPPSVTSYSLSATTFRAASSGGSVIARKRPPIGTRVKFALSEAATMTFTVKRVLPGRKRAGRCEKPSKRNRRGKKCTRLVSKGSFKVAGVAGANSFKFTGRLKGRKLAPGSYKLIARAKDAAGNKSRTSARSFKIVR
jgi:hypothetical protein